MLLMDVNMRWDGLLLFVLFGSFLLWFQVLRQTSFLRFGENAFTAKGDTVCARNVDFSITADFSGPTNRASSGAPGSLVFDGVCLGLLRGLCVLQFRRGQVFDGSIIFVFDLLHIGIKNRTL